MQTIEIKTTQNVVIEHELAPVGSRVLAWILDFAIMGAALALHLYLIFLISIGEPSDTFYICFSIYFTLLYLSYDPVCEIFFNGQTLGKRALGIRAIKLDRSRSDIQSFLIRSVFRMTDINLSLGSLAFIMISSSAKRQRLGDLLAHTAVVKTESRVSLQLSDLLNIDTMENYTPSYPQVKQLHDEDIITIRQVLERLRKHPNKGSHAALDKLVVQVCLILEIDEPKESPEHFLRGLVKDYIVLTR